MKLIDSNLLLYSVNPSAARHELARDWLEGELSKGSRLLFPWLSLAAFVRISTAQASVANPLTADQAISLVEDWLEPDGSIVPVPDSNHLARWQSLIEATGTGGNIVNDAHIAAIALQYNATVVSFDNDFARFPGVAWELPS
jgi:toxin-antitoxin system PIN domain toxin